MALRYMDGFDWCDDTQVSFKYSDFSTGTPQSAIVTGRQPPNLVGGGRALHLENSGFGIIVYTKQFTAQAIWIVGFNIFLTRSNLGGVIFRWESGPGDGNGGNLNTQLTAAINPPGQLAFYSGSGSGKNNDAGPQIAATNFGALPINTWVYLEIKVHFGVGGRIQVNIEDQAVLDVNPVNVGRSTPQNPDRLSILYQALSSSGYILDDLYYADGSGAVNKDFLGICRVTADFPNSDATAEHWTPNLAGATHVSRIQEQPPAAPCPDGDSTYLQGNHVGDIDLFTLNSMPCYGRVLGVAANATGRIASGGAAAVDLLVRPKPSDPLSQTLIGGTTALQASYHGLQGVSDRSLITGDVWTDREIDGAWWGFEAISGVPRMTQLYIEKLTSLRNVPFNCGGSAFYSF